VETDSADCRQAQFKGHDLSKAVAGHGDTPVPAGEIVRACFAINYTTGGRARNSEVRLPNVAEHDRDRDGITNQDFLRANGFVVIGDDADRLVGAA
jgi:hypothetical protein